MKIRNWKVDIQEDMKGVFKFNNIVEEIISMRSDSNMEFNSYLIEVSNFMKFMEAELPKLVERYKNQLK